MKERNEINGYVVIYLPSHHKAMQNDNWKGWVYEHIVIAEETLGRDIKEGEEVHHLDFNTKNNKPSNLIVLEIKQHVKLHKWMQRGFPIDREGKGIVLRCSICGKPLKEKLKYFCSEDCKTISRNKNCKMCNVTKQEILEKLETRSMVSVAKDYNISDNGLKKWLNKNI